MTYEKWVASVELTGNGGEIEVAVHRLGEREVVLDPSTLRFAITAETRASALIDLSVGVYFDATWIDRAVDVDTCCAFLADNEGYTAFRAVAR